MKELPISISKRILWRFINKKLDHKIHHYHVFSIITILFDEILNDLKSGKDIKIFNFGTLSLDKTKPRLYFDIVRKKKILSAGNKILKFLLAPKIRKNIKDNLDIDLTFNGD